MKERHIQVEDEERRSVKLGLYAYSQVVEVILSGSDGYKSMSLDRQGVTGIRDFLNDWIEWTKEQA